MAMQQLIDFDWLKTPSAQEYVESLLHRGKRRHFGLLERPSLPPNRALNSIKYKIFLCGKAGVGKSATITNLAGCKVNKSINETAGIESTLVYWPVRLISTGQVMFFQLHFWDVGENAVKKFDHILPACRSNVDCILFTFSFTDRSSYMEIPSLLNQYDDEGGRNPIRVVVGTKTDQYAYSDVSDAEVDELSQARKVTVLRTKNMRRSNADGRESINEVAPFLNKLCNLLFQRDHVLANTT